LPELHIITGSNGAGKSSVGPEYLPNHIKNSYSVFDGDKLALEKTKELFASKRYSYKDAKNLANDWVTDYFNEQVTDAIARADNFAYEGHFREESAWMVLERFQKHGYTIHLIFLGLINVERSAMRVLERALSGGHNVSPAEIDLNYHGNLLQLDRHFKMLNQLRIIDTSETAPKVLLELSGAKIVFCLPFSDLPDWFSSNLIQISRFLYPDI
jgi:predicted ABC-type ATPase